ncbi:MAG: Rap1a/Tai family immunity protein [Gammaproteobacteria bacterium]
MKKIKKYVFAMVFGAISYSYSASCFADAPAFINGSELLRLCDGAVESNYSRATDCLGYITGLSDGHEVFHDLGLVSKQWCWPPEGISNREMAAIVHKYLQANPALLGKSAALLAMFALFDAYPCT